MIKKVSFIIALFVASFLLTLYRTSDNRRKELKEDHAMEMFDWWYSQRALPFDHIPAGAYQKAILDSKFKLKKERTVTSAASGGNQWTSLGPNNIGGRILSLAIDPTNTNTIWAGSASGGLWKSTTGGQGSTGWTYVNTGFSTISIGTIAINPTNPNFIYLGTGELSFYQFGLVGTPGARSSYGMGILRSTDRGTTWNQTDLTWTIPQVTGVQKIIINPINTNSLYAATTEGVYKSSDAGAHWLQSSTILMAMDIVLSPDDTSTIYASHGNLNSTMNPGIYKTTNAGTTWTQLTNGLPSTNFGRTALAISPAAPSTIYAGISNGDPNNGGLIGLFKSSDRGTSWMLVTNANYVSSQGWYDNVVAVNPNTPDSIYCAGLDVYLSINGGSVLAPISDWSAYYMGTPSPGGSEGSTSYVHADQHAIVFDPVLRKTIYIGTDGGVFKSNDGGFTFFGVNGGLTTTQFYNGFASANDDSTIALGGLQDNGVIKYQGSSSWRKVDAGDGGWNAIDPTNHNILYDEYVYLSLSKSTNGGASFFSIDNNLPGGPDNANFIAPFILSPSSPNILYAGTKNIYKSTDGGINWVPTNNGANLNGTKISCIGVSSGSSDTVLTATGSSISSSPVFQVFATTNGGQIWSNVTGTLPSRYPTDIVFDPTNSMTVYITYSGYGTPHLFRTTNLGRTWMDISSGVDIPHQSVTVDPIDPGNIYVGTDLGVYHSSDYGASWEDFNTGMNPAMVLDLSISAGNQAIRAATFGSGVYERKLVHIPQVAVVSPNGGEIFVGRQVVQLTWTEKYLNRVRIEYSLDNGSSWNLIADSLSPTLQSYPWTVPDTSTTMGLIRVSDPVSGMVSDVSDSTFSIDLTSDVMIGWNLLSLHLSPSDHKKSDLFPTSVSSAFIYQNGYVVAESLFTGAGFWLKYNQPFIFSFAGDSILAETVAVKVGWNIVGAPSRTTPVTAVTSLPDSIISSPFYGFRGAYFTPDSLEPKQGYWVKVKSDGQLILNSSLSTQLSQQKDILPSVASITITDADGKHQVLSLTDKPVDVNRYELPPIPPGDAFDIRFASQRTIEEISQLDSIKKEFQIVLNGVRFPIKIHFNDRSLFKGTLSLKEESGNTAQGGDAQISQMTAKLILEYIPAISPVPPVSFELGQNYPNPFNPSTTITYSLPVQGYVKLVVYSMLGQTVATLIDRSEDAGIHRVEWDAANFSSGIYLYKMVVWTNYGEQTSGFRKMVLIR
jgi:photosystem II stability/assembly factor-like uncharacterized protein